MYLISVTVKHFPLSAFQRTLSILNLGFINVRLHPYIAFTIHFQDWLAVFKDILIELQNFWHFERFFCIEYCSLIVYTIK